MNKCSEKKTSLFMTRVKHLSGHFSFRPMDERKVIRNPVGLSNCKAIWIPDQLSFTSHSESNRKFSGKTFVAGARGFTLVELSIVLVIIGLIIGGVLTGQQIIQNARINNAVNGIQAYQAQFQTYAQNYGALPGDDPSAPTRFSSLAVEQLGNNDGKVGTATSFDTATTTSEAKESLFVWAHLRAAGLVKNQVTNGSTAVQPPNPFGGIYGFQNGAFGAFTTTVLCMDKVSAGPAQAIDARLDDGKSDAGSIQGTVYTAVGKSDAAAAETYSDDNTYTLCVKM